MMAAIAMIAGGLLALLALAAAMAVGAGLAWVGLWIAGKGPKP